ncbi:MAG: hypothetical protein LBV41_07530 [Cytophagaceae bacterium]|jgi:hypothetical protein|nr:hypothetical protein [Cytophagaceae bacterium]
MAKTLSITLTQTIARLTGYNLKVIFGNRFVYFFGASLLFYLLITAINVFSTDVVTVSSVYYMLILPALLFIFFPTVFGIQNDADARILEIIFGIPNYRYKVYLIRLVIILIIQWFYMMFLAALSGLLLIQTPVAEMATRLMVPVMFFGMVGFAFSTVIRSGSGTIVVLIAVGLLFWILTNSGVAENSYWNVFLNPFAKPDSMSEQVWETIVQRNRTVYPVTSLVLLLWGMLNLQKREKFMK